MTPLRLWIVVRLVCALGGQAAEVVDVGAGSYLRGLPKDAKGPPGQSFVVDMVNFGHLSLR